MKEEEVNVVCKKWIEDNNYKYKGVLNKRPRSYKERNGVKNGWGQVPVPDGIGNVLIDHQGIGDVDSSLIWIEAKGERDSFSELLQGFIRIIYACYHGGGKGLLAVPDKEYSNLMEYKEFISKVASASERQIGIFNAEKNIIKWLN